MDCSNGVTLLYYVCFDLHLSLETSSHDTAVRFNALSRNLEAALQKEGIPNRVLSGQKFFDRVEVRFSFQRNMDPKFSLDQRPASIPAAHRQFQL